MSGWECEAVSSYYADCTENGRKASYRLGVPKGIIEAKIFAWLHIQLGSEFSFVNSGSIDEQTYGTFVLVMKAINVRW